MKNPTYFRTSISEHTGLILLLILCVLFTSLAQFASFALIQNYVVGAFGAQSEDVSLAFQMTYVGILVGLPLQFRFQRYFNTKIYLVTALVCGIIVNMGSLLTTDIDIFTLLRFIQGLITAVIAGNILIILFSILPKEKSMIVGSSVFFGFILICGVIIGVAGAWVTLRTDWKALYYFLIALQVFSIIICYLLFKSKSIHSPYPLYQLDLIGIILFSGFAYALTYTMIYGPKLDWLESKSIQKSILFGTLAFILLVYRQLNLKRPYLNLQVFRHKKFIIGIILLSIFYGTKDSINLIYNYAGGILGWHTSDIISLGFYNVLGVLLGTGFAAFGIIKNKSNVPKLILAGFCVLLIYHVLIFNLMIPSLAFNDLIIPIMLQGFASGLLFVPIVIFSLSTLPDFTGYTGIIICAYVRFAATLNGISGYYTLQLYYNQLYKSSFLGHITGVDYELAQRTAAYSNFLQSKGYYGQENTALVNTLISKSIGLQSQLLTNKAVFFGIALLLAIVITLLLIYIIANKINSNKPQLSIVP